MAIENACDVKANLTNGLTCMCTLPRGHVGAHVDRHNLATWNDPEVTAQESIEKATRAQIDAMASREAEAVAFARTRDEEHRTYDQAQGALARAHGWALLDAEVWARFAATAQRSYAASYGPQSITSESAVLDIAEEADRLFAKWRKRFANPEARPIL